MTTRVLDRAGVEAALAVAVRAPSIHNTQPWGWRWDGRALELRADRTRQLHVADPDGHSLLVSCGAALHLTELALCAQGFTVETDVLPHSSDSDLLAVLRIVGSQEPDPQVLTEVDAALARRSDRRPYQAQRLPDDQVELLRKAGSDAVAYVDFPRDRDQAVDLAVAVSWADSLEKRYSDYQEEMQRWLHDPDVHATSDGIPLTAVPRVEPGHQRHLEVPQRDFEVGVAGKELIAQDQDEKARIGVVFTRADAPADRLGAGVAMMRVMIAAQIAGLATCPLSQAVDLPALRGRLQVLMNWTGYPQMMLRIGYPGTTLGDPVRTPRRDVSAVLDITA